MLFNAFLISSLTVYVLQTPNFAYQNPFSLYCLNCSHFLHIAYCFHSFTCLYNLLFQFIYFAYCLHFFILLIVSIPLYCLWLLFYKLLIISIFMILHTVSVFFIMLMVSIFFILLIAFTSIFRIVSITLYFLLFPFLHNSLFLFIYIDFCFHFYCLLFPFS